MDLPAHLLDNPADESFWDTHKVHTELSAHGGSTSLRSTERLLEKVLWMPSVRSLLDLRDELDRPLVRLVVDAVEAQAKKKRISMLLLQVARVASDKYVVFVNDGRGGRRWRFVEQLNVQTIADALARLSAGKSVYIWPHGQATGWLRRIEAARKSAQMVQSDGTILTLVLTPYRATLELAPYPKSPERQNNDLTHLDALEAESIHIMREVMAQADNPVMLYKRRQRQLGDVTSGAQSVLPQPTAVSVNACGYALEISGDVRLQRPNGQRSGYGADCPYQPRGS